MRPSSAGTRTEKLQQERGRGRAFDDRDYQRLAEFRYTLRCFLRFSEVAAKALGLTGQQYQALLAVRGARDRNAATINELRRRLLIKHNSAVGLVDRLVRSGLLRRAALPGDARQVQLRITAKGLRLLERLAGVHREELERLRSQMLRLGHWTSRKP